LLVVVVVAVAVGEEVLAAVVVEAQPVEVEEPGAFPAVVGAASCLAGAVG